MAPLMLIIGMICALKRQKRTGATSAELLVIIILLLVACFVAAPRIVPTKGDPLKAQRIKCVNNLKNVGLAVRIYAIENNDRFPYSTAGTNRAAFEQLKASDYYLALTNELSTPKIITCPSDANRRQVETWPGFSNESLGFFANLSANHTNPAAFLAGDRNLMLNGQPLARGPHEIFTSQALSWSPEIHNESGNVARADGSVQQFSNQALLRGFPATGVATNRLLIP